MYAQVIFVIIVALTFAGVHLGVGRHIWDVPFANFLPLAILGNVNAFLTILGSTWSKTSFAVTLLRLPIGNLRYFVWFVIVSMNLLLTISAVSLWFECRPVPPGQPASTGCLPKSLILSYGVIAGGMAYPRMPCAQTW